MKITVDIAKCQGHARCYALAPELFELDDDGYNQTSNTDVPPGQESAAELAAGSCPEGVISIIR